MFSAKLLGAASTRKAYLDLAKGCGQEKSCEAIKEANPNTDDDDDDDDDDGDGDGYDFEKERAPTLLVVLQRFGMDRTQ